jgi:DNA-binding response OmpR family regulator
MRMRESILNNKRVLAVDDEPDVLETLEEQIEEFLGLVFDKATNYEAGYHLLRSWTYDLVILDTLWASEALTSLMPL